MQNNDISSEEEDQLQDMLIELGNLLEVRNLILDSLNAIKSQKQSFDESAPGQ